MLYLKMLLTSFTNSQNEWLLTSKNFGVNGNLSTYDQFNIVFGYILFIVCMVIFIMLNINLMGDVPWMYSFGKRVQGRENILRRKANHKWFLFTMAQYRTIFSAMLIMFAGSPSFAVP